VANRQNEISKQLAIIATIFLPLADITGFFGMNFATLTNASTTPARFWWLRIGSQVLTAIVLLVYFRAKRWF
jgi:magnesium transporter